VTDDRPLRVRATNSWWPLDFDLVSSEQQVVTWFRHHLHTAATPARDLGPRLARTLAAVVDEELTDRLADVVRHCGPRGVEGHVGEFWSVGPTWRGDTWCYRHPPGARRRRHVIVAEGQDRWSVVGVDPDEVATAAVRLGREMIRTELARRGAFTVHASFAVAPDLAGVMFVGATGGGKTTMALALARSGGYLVSGDQSEVLPTPDGPPLGVGFPWVSRIGVGTLTGLGLDGLVESAALLRPQPSIVDGRITDRARAFGSPDKVELTGLELDAVLGVRGLDGAPVDALVVLTPAAPGEPLRVVPTDLADVREDLRREYREPDPAHAGFWLAPPDRQPPHARDFGDFLEALDGVPVFRLRWSPQRHRAQEAVAALRATLPAARSAPVVR